MKILHSAALLESTPGVLSQMEDERRAALSLGIEWEACFFPSDAKIRKSTVPETPLSLVPRLWKRMAVFWRKGVLWVVHRIKYHLWLWSRKDVDVHILRYSVHDPFQLLFIWLTKKPVYFLHHTLEVPELRQAGCLSTLIRAPLERMVGSISIRLSDGCIGVTKEIVRYESLRSNSKIISSYVYPNGILYELPIIEDSRKGKNEWLFIASFFYPWHGLDRLLSALRCTGHDIVLHVVGKVSDDDRIAAEQDKRVVLHGILSSEEIRRLSGRCCLGLSSFALDRKGMREACTLKVREYLMLGLPVVAGHSDVFPEDFPYFLNSDVSIDTIFNFSQNASLTTRRSVSEAARPYIDKEKLLAGLVEYIYRDIEAGNQ